MTAQRLWLAALAALAIGLPLAPRAAAGTGPPPAGHCPALSGGVGEAMATDAVAPNLREGDVLLHGQLPALQSLFPPEVWNHRDVFFFEGMNLKIGSCHRVYPPSRFYAEATARHAGSAKLDEDGNLSGYQAGTPFPPETIADGDPQAGWKWAWDLQYRDRGAGPVGRFRLMDLPARPWRSTPKLLRAQEQHYEGDFFLVRTAHRADLLASSYQVPESTSTSFAAGGEFTEPFNARGLAWRQLRERDADEDWRDPDDTFVYVPDMRKPRRAASGWVDGLYTPRYRVAGEGGGGATPFNQGGSTYAPALTGVSLTSGLAIQATEDIRRGFTGLVIRPNAYTWTVVGAREVLAPLNAEALGWPLYPDRNYGTFGLSVATDRWDVRWAVVVRGKARRVVDDVGYVAIWIDWQTQQPLYYITYRPNGAELDVGILVHQYSGDRADYPVWPGGEAANVFDPVAAVFFFAPDGGSGWRRESYDAVSVPVDPDKLRKYTSTIDLMKGH